MKTYSVLCGKNVSYYGEIDIEAVNDAVALRTLMSIHASQVANEPEHSLRRREKRITPFQRKQRSTQ
jgi:hypothetical protein